MNNKPKNLDAKKALEQLKMEVSNELSSRLADEQKLARDVTRALVARAEEDLYDEDIINPS